MKELFREKDFTRVGYFQGILEAEGIPTFVRNQDTTTFLTEVPIPEFYPALCVMNDEDYEEAVRIIRDCIVKDSVSSETEVQCPKCRESNPGNFETCWACGSELVPATA
jgi:hypothetical protein